MHPTQPQHAEGPKISSAVQRCVPREEILCRRLRKCRTRLPRGYRRRGTPATGSRSQVIRPTPQDAVQLVAHFRPRFGIAGHQHVVHLLSQSRYTFLRRTCSKYQWPSSGNAAGQTCIPESRSSPAGLPQFRLRFVQVSPRHVITCRVQSRASAAVAASGSRIVRVVDDLRLEDSPPLGDSPILQEPVHVELASRGLATPPCGVPRLLPDLPSFAASLAHPAPRPGLQPHLHQMQHLPSTMRRATHDISSRCGMLSKYLDKSASTTPYSLHREAYALSEYRLRTTPRSITISTGFQIRLEDRLQHQLGGGLHHPVPYRRNPQWSFATPGFGIITRRTG